MGRRGTESGDYFGEGVGELSVVMHLLFLYEPNSALLLQLPIYALQQNAVVAFQILLPTLHTFAFSSKSNYYTLIELNNRQRTITTKRKYNKVLTQILPLNDSLLTMQRTIYRSGKYRKFTLLRSVLKRQLPFGVCFDDQQLQNNNNKRERMINFSQKLNLSKPTQTQTSKKENKPALSKYQSQPKFSSLKEEILKIPKVKQILQKDRLVYSQDIEKRVELLGSVKSDNFIEGEVVGLHELRKKVEKKTKRHKTNFKIPLTRKNIESLNCLVKEHIAHNQFFKNEQKIFLKEYQDTAPFDLQQLKFMDDINPLKIKYKQKFPDLKEGVLAKNKLTLEHVVLNRNIKREMKLDQQKLSKINGKKILDNKKD